MDLLPKLRERIVVLFTASTELKRQREYLIDLDTDPNNNVFLVIDNRLRCIHAEIEIIVHYGWWQTMSTVASIQDAIGNHMN